MIFTFLAAEAGGFEPPVRLPVRQFSKLVVSATHPNFLEPAFSLKCGANIGGTFGLRKSFSKIFFSKAFNFYRKGTGDEKPAG